MAGQQKTVSVIDSATTRKSLPLVKGEGEAYAVLWPGNGAVLRSIHVIELKPGDTTRDLSHRNECVYFIETGEGVIRDLSDDSTQSLIPGSMIHIGPEDAYRIEAGETGMRAIGGPVPVDPTLYKLEEEGAER